MPRLLMQLMLLLVFAACSRPGAQEPAPARPVSDRFIDACRTLAEWAKRPHYTRCVGWSEERSPRLDFLRARVAVPEGVTLFHFHAVCDPNHPDAAGALLEDRYLLARVGDAHLYDLFLPDDLVAFAAAERLALRSAADVRALLGADHDPLLTVEPDRRDAHRFRVVRAFSGRDLPPSTRILVLDDAGVPQRLEPASS